MRELLRPVATTLLLALLYFGYNFWLSATGANKLTASELPEPGARAQFEVLLNYPPEKFHITRMQKAGRLTAVNGYSVFLLDVERDDAIELARNYWIADIKPWRGP